MKKRKCIEQTLNMLREQLIDEITDLFYKNCKKDHLGDLSIHSSAISEESIYLVIENEPSFNDKIEEEIICLGEINEFWKNIDDICVSTFEYGSISIDKLPIESLLKCYEYLKEL